MPGSSLPHLGGEVPDIPVPVPDEVARLAFEVASSGASPLPTTPARSSSASTLAQLRHMHMRMHMCMHMCINHNLVLKERATAVLATGQ